MSTIVNSNFYIKGLFFIALGFAFYYSGSFLLPMLYAFILSFLFFPPVQWLEKKYHVPRFIGAAIVLILFLTVVGFGFYYLYQQTQEWIKNAAQFEGILGQKFTAFSQKYFNVQNLFSTLSPSVVITTVMQNVQSWGGVILTNTKALLVEVGFMLILLYFLLASQSFYLKKFIVNFSKGEKNAGMLVSEMERQVCKYLFTMLLLNILVAFVVSLILFAFRVPNPVLWGMLAGILEFIPFIGATIFFVVITLVSIIAFENVLTILMVPITYLIYIVIHGNLVVPYVLVKRFVLNKVAVILGIFFMSWFWGVMGVFLAIPLMMTLKIILDNFNKDNFFSNLLEE